MRFYATFKSDYSFPVATSTVQMGLSCARQIREDLGVNVSIDLIESTVKGANHNVVLEFDEMAAEITGCFENDNSIYITTPPKFLNRYLDLTTFCERDMNNDAIISARMERVVDLEKLHEDWVNAGCPLKWGFDTKADTTNEL